MGTAEGCGDCWKPRKVAGNAPGPHATENAIFIFIIFSHNSNKPRPQTESGLFSDLAPRSTSSLQLGPRVLMYNLLKIDLVYIL